MRSALALRSERRLGDLEANLVQLRVVIANHTSTRAMPVGVLCGLG
jgi:hypothetical protein